MTSGAVDYTGNEDAGRHGFERGEPAWPSFHGESHLGDACALLRNDISTSDGRIMTLIYSPNFRKKEHAQPLALQV